MVLNFYSKFTKNENEENYEEKKKATIEENKEIKGNNEESKDEKNNEKEINKKKENENVINMTNDELKEKIGYYVIQKILENILN